MKQQKRKLTLNKVTVANLERKSLSDLFGGLDTTAPCIPSDPCAPTVGKQATCKDTCFCNTAVSYNTNCACVETYTHFSNCNC